MGDSKQIRKPRIAIGITGSSGAVYALDFLKRYPHDKYLIMSKWGKAVMKDELKMSEPEKALKPYYTRSYCAACLWHERTRHFRDYSGFDFYYRKDRVRHRRYAYHSHCGGLFKRAV
jgi:hypothetical protein